MRYLSHNDLFVILVVAVLVPCQVSLWAWGVTHRDITRAALQMLPQWQQEVWKDEASKLIASYCMFPDRASGKSPEILREVRPYLYFDEKGWLLHYFPGESYEANRERVTPGFEWVASNVIESLRAGEKDEAARYAGGLSHALQDASSPIHSLEGPDDLRGIINLVHAPPPKDPYYNVWAAFWTGGTPDGSKLAMPGYRPRLLGTSPPEIAWRLYDGYRRILTNTRCQLVAAIDAIYTGMDRSSPEWRAIWDPMAVTPSQVLADFYYTCMCVASDRIDPEQLAELQRVRIELTHPIEAPLRLSPPYQYVPVARDVALDRDGTPVPLALRMGDGKVRRFEHGFSTGSATECVVAYQVPPQVFDRFTGWVGLHPDLAPQEQPSRATIEIRFGGKAALETGEFGPNSAAVKIDVPVSSGGPLEFICRDATASNVIVWADTALIRKTDAPQGGGLPAGWEKGPRQSAGVRKNPRSAESSGWLTPSLRQIAEAAIKCLPAADTGHFTAERDIAAYTQNAKRLGTNLLDYDSVANRIESLVRRIAQQLKAGERGEVTRSAGELAALVADRTSPVKCLDGRGEQGYRAFAQLFPPPPNAPFATAVAVLAVGMEAIRPDLSDYRPRLMGTSPAEAAFHARQAYVRMVEASCYDLPALVQARYDGAEDRAQTLLNGIAERPARLVADLLHTAICLAEDRYEPAEMEWFATVDLTHAAWSSKPGYAGGPYRTQPTVYGASLQKDGRKEVPLKLRFVENGQDTVRTFERGLGVGGHAKWAFAFKIPPKVFGALDIHLGMHATLGNVASYGKKHGCMQLQIKLDDSVLFDSGTITPDVPASHVVADVRAGGLLQLCMLDRSGHWANYGNQVVYGEPILRRAADAPRGLER